MERDPLGTGEDHVSVARLSGEDQGEVVDELAVRSPGDRDPDPGVRLLAVGAHLLDAGQRVVGGVDTGLHTGASPPRDRLNLSSRSVTRIHGVYGLTTMFGVSALLVLPAVRAAGCSTTPRRSP